MAQTKNPLDVWAHQRENVIDLRSGAGTATVQAFDLTEALTTVGRIPNPLRGIAARAESGDFNPSTLDDEDLKDWFDLRCHVVAQAVKSFKPKKGAAVKGPLEQEFVAHQMPPEDRDQIWALATHAVTANQLMDLMGLSPFRLGAGRPATAESGEGNGASAE